jgi:probable F420-dependent oxidoreductase
VKYGAHLPLIDFAGEARWTSAGLIQYAQTAEALGFGRLCVNDHLIFPRPWLDGPTALALVASHTQQIGLMTTVALPVVRGPLAFAKTMASLDVLSGGRVTVGVGPGSSPFDYRAVGLDFEERWKRLDDAVGLLRAVWSGNKTAYSGRFYTNEGVPMEPVPAQAGGLPIWIGSWGSTAGLRRVARLADGWLASAYNTDPPLFAEALAGLRKQLPSYKKDASTFPNAIATMFMYITEDATEADHMLRSVVAKTVRRPEDELQRRLLIGAAEECAAKLAAYRDAGAEAVFVWPVARELEQLELFTERVAPKVR